MADNVFHIAVALSSLAAGFAGSAAVTA